MDQEHRSHQESPIGRISSLENYTHLPIITNEYMPKGETWIVEGNTVLVTPWNDIVWEKTRAKIIREQRRIGKFYVDSLIHKLEVQLHLRFDSL